MRILTPLLLATASLHLWAGVPVALSLTNAADYVSTIPVNSNLIEGIGMGAGGAYTTLRAEDAEFLTAAFVERFYFASGSGGRYTVSGAVDHHLARLPSKASIVEDGESMISNSYPVSWGVAINPALGGTYDRHGFVPANFPIWDSCAPSETSDGWTRNGYGATNDLRAVFGAGATGFDVNDIPFAITNLFRHFPTMAAVTNAYSVIASSLCSNILATASVYDLESWASCTTNTHSFNNLERDDITNITYQTYSYAGETYGIPIAYATRTVPGSQTKYNTRVNQSMRCFVSLNESWETPFGVRRTGESSGVVNTLQPFRASAQIESSLPSNGTPWTVSFAVVAGSRDSFDPVFNTNLVAKAWLVSLWECTSTLRFEWTLGLDGTWQTETTSTVSRALSSYPLGQLVFGPQSQYSNYSNFLWSTNGPFEGFGTGVFDTQNAFVDVSDSFFDTGSFTDVSISSPKIVVSSDFPSTVTNGWGRNMTNYGIAYSYRRHELRSVANYAVLIVTPQYFARVLGELTQ